MKLNKYIPLINAGVLALVTSCATPGYKSRIIVERDSQWRESTTATLDARIRKERLVLGQGIALKGATPELVYDVARNLAEYRNNPEAYTSGLISEISENDIASAIHEIARFGGDGTLLTEEELNAFGYHLSELRTQFLSH